MKSIRATSVRARALAFLFTHERLENFAIVYYSIWFDSEHDDNNSEDVPRSVLDSMSIEEIEATSVEQFDPYRATGLWHILATNLPIWKNKLLPTVTYSIHEKLADGRVCLNDLVEYQSKRPCVGYRQTSIDGIDSQLTTKPSRFQWQGTGMWRLFKNDFGYVAVDNQTSTERPYEWLAKISSATLWSTAGIDLMTRTRQPPTYVLNEFVRFCRDHPLLRLKSANMFYTREKPNDEIYYIRDLQID